MKKSINKQKTNPFRKNRTTEKKDGWKGQNVKYLFDYISLLSSYNQATKG